MAAKKTSKKSAPKKAVKAKKAAAKKTVKKAPAKKAVKKAAVKKAAVKKKAVVKKTVKKAAKKPVVKKPAKKTAPKKAAPKKAAPKKVSVKAKATKVVKKVAEKVEKPVVAEKPAKAVKKVAAKKKAPARKSSLVSTPPPPAPVKPPFVPPKSDKNKKNSSNGRGTHSASFIEKQYQRLLDLKDTLLDSMTGMTRDTIRNAPEGSDASGSGQHQGDAGSDAYDRDFALSVLANEQDALYEIEQALRRIQAGSYGLCEISQNKIPAMRLEAIPFARLTVECQAEWEQEYGNRRFRPSDEVGFSGGASKEDEDSVRVSLDDRDN